MDSAPLNKDNQPTAASEQDIELVETVHSLLLQNDLDAPRFAEMLDRLERRHGGGVYVELLFILSHLRFTPEEARRHWEAIQKHRATMRDRLATSVDLRVALVSYFLEINKKLTNPKVIELKIFEQTQASAYRDELTGLCNFRYFKDHLAREIHRSERFGLPVSLVMVDIDDFKHFNDTNGHEAGNQALAEVARLLIESLRKIDVAARYGGEEFAIILPSTSKTAAIKIAERARRRIESHAFQHATDQPGGRLTVSMGVASHPADAGDATDLVSHADSALYVSKTLGKNQVHPYSQSRRSFRRVDAAIEGRFAAVSEKVHPLRTINIGPAGVLFRTGQRVSSGAVLELHLSLPGSVHEIAVTGDVIRVTEKPRGHFETALRFRHMSPADRSLLSDFIEASGVAGESGAPSVRTDAYTAIDDAE
jgi:diguanylate cyclase (GGDEF)-like protein